MTIIEDLNVANVILKFSCIYNHFVCNKKLII